MCQCLTKENKRTCSDLLRHEVAFVIRQMTECYKPAISYFLECLADQNEAPIVRHEILITLGMLLDDKTCIVPFLDDPDFVVAQSCQVAINIINCKNDKQKDGGAGSDE